MNTKRYNDGILYGFIGTLCLLLTIDLVFPLVMCIMKGIFYIMGTLMIVGGLIQIKDSFKKKKTQ